MNTLRGENVREEMFNCDQASMLRFVRVLMPVPAHKEIYPEVEISRLEFLMIGGDLPWWRC